MSIRQCSPSSHQNIFSSDNTLFYSTFTNFTNFQFALSATYFTAKMVNVKALALIAFASVAVAAPVSETATNSTDVTLVEPAVTDVQVQPIDLENLDDETEEWDGVEDDNDDDDETVDLEARDGAEEWGEEEDDDEDDDEEVDLVARDVSEEWGEVEEDDEDDNETSDIIARMVELEARGSPKYLNIANTYRKKAKLPTFKRDKKLERNALKTVKASHGKMIHQINKPTMGQVLAPGKMSNFKHIYVGGWLCERPKLKWLGNECKKQSVGWLHTSTGHADILNNKKFKYIGCAEAYGIVGCDVR